MSCECVSPAMCDIYGCARGRVADQTKITGYRELDEIELGLINKIKELANDVGVIVETLSRNADGLDIDGRWVAIARTDLQTGFMALVRAVAKPTSF